MAICRCYGYLDLFITFTYNIEWPVIQQVVSLIPGKKKPQDKLDIVLNKHCKDQVTIFYKSPNTEQSFWTRYNKLEHSYNKL